MLLENVVEGARILTLTRPKEIASDWPAACRIWRSEYCRMNEGLNRSDRGRRFLCRLVRFQWSQSKIPRALGELSPSRIPFIQLSGRSATNLEVLARVKKGGAELSYLIADLRSNEASSTAIFGVDEDGHLRIIQDGSDRSSRRMLPPHRPAQALRAMNTRRQGRIARLDDAANGEEPRSF